MRFITFAPQFDRIRVARWVGAAMLTLPLLTASPTRAEWSAANDEANRQRMMASMRDTAAANDRRNADASFQKGLAGGLSTTGGSGGTAPNSATPSTGAFAATPGAERGPQSVVATRTVFINIEETTPQMVARVTREAAEGKAQSQYNLGRLNYAGLGVARDDVAARRWFGAAATQGHPAASAQYGYLTMYGRGGPVDRDAARAALKIAAAGGDSYGQALYGMMLITDAVEKRTSDAPLPEAIGLLTRAADAGEAVAQATLGSVIYFYGTNGAEQDPAKAIHYLKLAAAQDHPMALQVLGEQYMVGGTALEKDTAKGWALITKAADLGQSEAMRPLGLSLVQGSNGQPKDPARGLKYIRMAADQHYPAAMGDYAAILYEGALEPKDLARSVRYAREAADAGDGDAQVMMARFAYFGDGVPKDMTVAARYARLAADSGHADGQHILGALYSGGEGVPKDMKEAVRWFRKSAAQGNADAIAALQEPESIAAARGM